MFLNIGRVMPEVILSVSGLEKSYDEVVAVAGLDFEIAKGECFGLLGPNGAGKSTTLAMLEGMEDPREELFNITAVRSRRIIKPGLVSSSRPQPFKIF